MSGVREPPKGNPQRETPPGGGVGPEMLSPAGLMSQSFGEAPAFVKSSQLGGGRPCSA